MHGWKLDKVRQSLSNAGDTWGIQDGEYPGQPLNSNMLVIYAVSFPVHLVTIVNITDLHFS